VLAKRKEENVVRIREYLDIDEFKNLPLAEEFIFINRTLFDLTISIVQVCDHPKLKEEVKALLQEAHDETKKELSVLRKEGIIKSEVRKVPKKIEFDAEVIEKAFKEYKEKIAGFDEFEGMKNFDECFLKYNNMLKEGLELEKIDISKAITKYLEILASTTPTGSTYWERPMILLEKIKMFDKALFICNRASVISVMPYVRMGDFKVRHARLKEKLTSSKS